MSQAAQIPKDLQERLVSVIGISAPVKQRTLSGRISEAAMRMETIRVRERAGDCAAHRPQARCANLGRVDGWRGNYILFRFTIQGIAMIDKGRILPLELATYITSMVYCINAI
jgi:hypothetical protein